MPVVGFIGTGAITAAMVEGLSDSGTCINVSERNTETAAHLAATFPSVSVLANAEVVAQSDVVILCLMAETARSVLPSLSFRADHKIISVMADVPLEQVKNLCAPATDVSLTIPLPSIAKGGCPLPVFPDTGAVRAVFGARNPVISVSSESGLNAHMGACAVSLPLLDLVRETRDWLATESNDPAGAELYLAAMFASYFNDIAAASPGRIDEMTQALSTPGGFNATVLKAIKDHGTPEALVNALDGLKPRLGLNPK